MRASWVVPRRQETRLACASDPPNMSAQLVVTVEIASDFENPLSATPRQHAPHLCTFSSLYCVEADSGQRARPGGEGIRR